jgi:hypothetical protein
MVLAVHRKRKATNSENAIGATSRVPATLRRRRYHAFRVWKDEVVRGLVASKEAATNSFNAPFVPCLLLWRDRFEDHVKLVIATDAHVGMIHRHYSACASNCLELWDQHPNGLQGFFAKATLGCELVRSDHAFVNFIKQELTERLQVIKCFIDDEQRTSEHGRLPNALGCIFIQPPALRVKSVDQRNNRARRNAIAAEEAKLKPPGPRDPWPRGPPFRARQSQDIYGATAATFINASGKLTDVKRMRGAHTRN